MACGYRQWNLRMGATQPVQGPLLGFRIGYCEGRQAGWEQRGNTHALLFLLSPAHKQEEAGPGWAGLDAHFPCSSISLCKTILPLPSPLFPTSPLSCPRVGLKSWKKAVSVPSQWFPPKVSTLLWAPLCLMQRVTAGEEPPLSSMCPKPGANSPS